MGVTMAARTARRSARYSGSFAATQSVMRIADQRIAAGSQ